MENAAFYNNIFNFIYKRIKSQSGEWTWQTPNTAAGFLAHETKHWIDGGVKSKSDEVNVYMWPKKVDLELKYTVSDVWRTVDTHPAYKHLNN